MLFKQLHSELGKHVMRACDDEEDYNYKSTKCSIVSLPSALRANVMPGLLNTHHLEKSPAFQEATISDTSAVFFPSAVCISSLRLLL